MLPIPQEILRSFDDLLNRRHVPLSVRPDYRKWLRYFLDFRHTYSLPEEKSEQVKLFADKLRSKNQATAQLEQAADAGSLFFCTPKQTYVSSYRNRLEAGFSVIESANRCTDRCTAFRAGKRPGLRTTGEFLARHAAFHGRQAV